MELLHLQDFILLLLARPQFQQVEQKDLDFLVVVLTSQTALSPRGR